MNSPKNGSSRWVNLGILAIIALLGVNAWLFYDKFNKEKVIEQQGMDLDEAERLNMELEKQYYETMSQLDEMRGVNEEMNQLIDKKNAELEAQKNEIARLIRSGGDMNQVRAKLREMEARAEEYLAELDALREQNALLTEANQQLGAEKQYLEENLRETSRQAESLSAERAGLSAEKAKLESQNVVLASKVNKASVVAVSGITVTGLKVSDSGKESKKRYANNVERLRICFDAGSNPVTDPGNEIFYIRVISPLGQTLAVDGMGSGILTTADGDQVRFSVTKSFDYNQEQVNTCLAWEPGIALDKGNYQIEIYNKGYLCGASNFKLK
jgi:hypothetical protein